MAITLQQFDKIEVEWLDAALGVNYDGPTNEAGSLVSMTRIGYFISRRKEPKSKLNYIVLASEKSAEGTVREPMSIPEQWVLRITRLDSGKTYGRGGRKRR